MIVSEKNVSDALTYLAQDPHPVALARKDVTDAKNKKEALFAEIYHMAEGTVRERECLVERSAEYRAFKTAEAEAECDLERHKARVRAAEMLCEIWRSENANVRAAERVR